MTDRGGGVPLLFAGRTAPPGIILLVWAASLAHSAPVWLSPVASPVSSPCFEPFALDSRAWDRGNRVLAGAASLHDQRATATQFERKKRGYRRIDH
jgi:hypothetical protein